MGAKRTAAPRWDLHPVVLGALIWLLVSDLPTNLRVGPLSLSGAITLLAGAAAVALAPMLVLHGRSRSAPRAWRYALPPGARRGVVPAALVSFCGIALVGLLRTPTQSGLQQVAVYCAFAGALGAAALYSTPDSAARFTRLLGVCMGVLALIAIPLYAAGSTAVGGARSFALTALLAVAVVVPLRTSSRLMRLAPWALTAAIAASLSRTALALAVLLLAFSVLRSRRGLRGLRIVLALGALALAGVVAFVTVPALRDRFTQGDNGVDVGGLALNTSGRSQLWALVVRSAQEHPWIGQGAGSASEVVTARYPFVGQPHNDYLRLWHDFGLIGLALFVLGYGSLLVSAVRRARRTAPEHRGIHWSAALALAAVGAAAATDNPLIYPFVMIPLAVVVGLSISRRHLHLLEPEATTRPQPVTAGR